MLVLNSITSSTITFDPGSDSWSASFLLGFGMAYWNIALVLLSCVASNACYESSCHSEIWLRKFYLLDSYSASNFNFILVTISTDHSREFINPIFIFLQHYFHLENSVFGHECSWIEAFQKTASKSIVMEQVLTYSLHCITI